jgi:hypothetical protein
MEMNPTSRGVVTGLNLRVGGSANGNQQRPSVEPPFHRFNLLTNHESMVPVQTGHTTGKGVNCRPKIGTLLVLSQFSSTAA